MLKFLRKMNLIVLMLVIGSGASLFATGAQEEKSEPSIVAVNMADTHSSYDTYPQILWKIKELKTDYHNSKILVLFDGDLFESGNIVSKKSNGLIDLEFLKSLGKYATVIINVGNHEFDVMNPKDFLASAKNAGAVVIGNVSAKDMPDLPPYTDVKLDGKTIRIIGLGVNNINTYPKALRKTISVPEPVKWMSDNYPKFSKDCDYSIILSHAGLVPDLSILKLFKDDTSVLYMAGAHDHINIHQKVADTNYMHNGFKGERLNIAEIYLANENKADVIFKNILTKDIKGHDKDLTTLIDDVTKKNLTDADRKIIGTVKKDMSVVEAALWSVEALRNKVGADAAFLNHTSFGSGLKKGPLAKYLFDQFMRFDNKVMLAEVDAKTLQAILEKCNQHEKEDIYKRSGDFLYTGKIKPKEGKTYKIVTSSWAALDFNQEKYFGQKIKFTQIPELTTKGIITESLK